MTRRSRGRSPVRPGGIRTQRYPASAREDRGETTDRLEARRELDSDWLDSCDQVDAAIHEDDEALPARRRLRTHGDLVYEVALSVEVARKLEGRAGLLRRSHPSVWVADSRLFGFKDPLPGPPCAGSGGRWRAAHASAAGRVPGPAGLGRGGVRRGGGGGLRPARPSGCRGLDGGPGRGGRAHPLRSASPCGAVRVGNGPGPVERGRGRVAPRLGGSEAGPPARPRGAGGRPRARRSLRPRSAARRRRGTALGGGPRRARAGGTRSGGRQSGGVVRDDAVARPGPPTRSAWTRSASRCRPSRSRRCWRPAAGCSRACRRSAGEATGATRLLAPFRRRARWCAGWTAGWWRTRRPSPA